MLTKSMQNTEVPDVIGMRTDELKPLLAAWKKKNRRVKYSHLLREALREKLKPLAGKRFAHLVAE